MAKDAKPDRFVVDRKGTPDPEGSEYYVVDVVHDRHARTALARLARLYDAHGQTIAAQEIDDLLARTSAAHAKLIEDQYQAQKARMATPRRSSRRR